MCPPKLSCPTLRQYHVGTAHTNPPFSKKTKKHNWNSIKTAIANMTPFYSSQDCPWSQEIKLPLARTGKRIPSCEKVKVWQAHKAHTHTPEPATTKNMTLLLSWCSPVGRTGSGEAQEGWKKWRRQRHPKTKPIRTKTLPLKVCVDLILCSLFCIAYMARYMYQQKSYVKIVWFHGM